MADLLLLLLLLQRFNSIVTVIYGDVTYLSTASSIFPPI